MEQTANVISLTEHRTRKVLDQCRTLVMLPLNADTRRRLTALVDNPTPATWDAAHSVIINGRNTLWQALIDHTSFRTGIFLDQWTHVPTPAETLAAITAAVNEPAPEWEDEHLSLV